MKLPFLSIQTLYADAITAARRFPLTLLAGVACTYVGIAVVNRSSGSWEIMRWMFVAMLALPTTVVMHLTWESDKFSRPIKIATVVLGLLALVGFYYWIRHSTDAMATYRFIQLAVAAHLLVAFICFAGSGTDLDFWRFNERLFIRFLQSGLYSAVLFLGIAACLETAHRLLEVPLPREVYPKLWMVMAFTFNTWFFLGGVPCKDFATTERPDYPVGLKIFTQYVLIPLVAIYLVILYAYVAKIVISWEWPKGMVGWLVASASIAGIFSLLLVYPFQFLAGNKWITTYAKGFYAALLPLVALLFVSTTRRISDYGITENRYFLWLLACWVASISLYFLVSRRKHLHIIPVSLCAIALLSCFGPWSAYSVSKRSQKARLLSLLSKHALFDGKKVTKSAGNLDYEVQTDLRSILRYLEKTHGGKALSDVGLEKPSKVMADLGLKEYYDRNDIDRFYLYQTNQPRRSLAVKGYDHFIQYDAWNLTSKKEQDVVIEDSKTTLHMLQDSAGLRLEGPQGQKLEVSFKKLIDELLKQKKSTELSDEFRVLTAKQGRSQAWVRTRSINGYREEGKYVVESLNLDILLRWE